MELSKKMREKGIKVTPQRRAVYKVLEQLCHCSVEEVVSAVTQQNPDITVSTVYNVLDSFAQRGLISRLSTPKGKLYYDITEAAHHHIFVDDDEIIDIKDEELTEIISAYLARKPLDGLEIDGLSLQIYARKRH